MKRFVVYMLSISIFFLGLGSLVENVGAKFKSDERALAIIRQARQAIGGDSAIAGVQSMRILGRTSKTFRSDAGEKTEQGETEIAFQLPDKMMKMVRIGDGGPDALGGEAHTMLRKVQVEVSGGEGHGEGLGSGSGGEKKIVIKSGDGEIEEIVGGQSEGEFTTPDGRKITIVRRSGDGAGDVKWKTEAGDNIMVRRVGEPGGGPENEMFRTALSLLLSTPQGVDVEYTFGGEADVDGTSCNIVVATAGGSSVKLFIGKSSNLPVMMSYTAPRMPMFFKVRTKAADGSEPQKDVAIFTTKVRAAPGELAEYQVRFSDYRSEGGVQLPHRWSTTVNEQLDEVFDVTSYEINPPNIADKFQRPKVMIKERTPGDK
jgi:hypothetical protein